MVNLWHMATTYDIAKLAGVDQSTVSKVLRGAPNFKQETIDKVHAACDKLGYIPNTTARQLRSNRTNVIAIDIPFSVQAIQADPFIPEFLAGVSQQANSAGYSILLSYASSSSPADLVLSRQADGIILTTIKANDPRITELTEKRVPFVAGKAQNFSSLNAACVDVDNYHCGLLAGEHLITHGHRNIAVLYHEKSCVGMDFAAGVRAALSKHGIFPNDDYFVRVDISATAAMAATEKLLNSPNPPTAITSNIFLAAFGLLKATENTGCYALAAGSSLFHQLYPHKGYIKVPTIELGELMTKTLIKILNGLAFAKLELLQSQIISAS